MTELLFKDEVYAIVGAAMEVYNELGLLINFGAENKLEWKRMILTTSTNSVESKQIPNST